MLRLSTIVRSHERLLSAVVVLLAWFNVTFRLGLESVGEWDESLYATTAWEMTRSGDLLRTTFDGALDYYNSKPPLNVWLIAAAYQLFGVSLVSLRIPSALAALATVLVFLWWTRRAFGVAASLFSSTVLATSFGYLHIHSARSGNPDAILTLLIVLIVVVLAGVPSAPWRRVWLGPLLGAVFLLKGMAVLQPFLLILLFEILAARHLKGGWLPRSIALLLCATIVSGWAWLRWQVDQWEFLTRIVGNDFLALSLTQLEGHKTGPFFYFSVLQRYQYEWVAVIFAAAALTWRSWRERLERVVNQLRERRTVPVLLLAWAIATLAVPSAMQTRVAWYLNPFYPLFALLAGLIVASSVSELRRSGRASVPLIMVMAVALIVAESKSIWRLYKVTNLDTSVQGSLIRNVRPGGGQRVYRDRLSRAEAFVVRAVLGAEFVVDPSLRSRPVTARAGDLLVVQGEQTIPGTRLLGYYDGHGIHQAE